MARSEVIVYDSLATKPGSLRNWVESVTGTTLPTRDRRGRFLPSRDHVINAAQIFRANVESGAVGGLLGYVDAKRGLDTKYGSIDGAGAIVNNLASLFLGKHEVSRDFLNNAAACFTVYSFRKTKDAVSAISRNQSATKSADNLEDAAKNL